MKEEWVLVEDFPDYSVSNLGQVRSEKFGRLINLSQTRTGMVKVGLQLGGLQYTRSVKVLVASAFIPQPDPIFNTPINLDGDPSNNVVDNLLWRPRWFAWKYHLQFRYLEEYVGTQPIRDIKTEVVYSDIAEAGVINGLLFYELLYSVINQVAVFPIWHNFEWA